MIRLDALAALEGQDEMVGDAGRRTVVWAGDLDDLEERQHAATTASVRLCEKPSSRARSTISVGPCRSTRASAMMTLGRSSRTSDLGTEDIGAEFLSCERTHCCAGRLDDRRWIDGGGDWMGRWRISLFLNKTVRTTHVHVSIVSTNETVSNRFTIPMSCTSTASLALRYTSRIAL